MDNEKQYLYAANGSYFGHCILSFVFLLIFVYGIFDRGWIDAREPNVFVGALCVGLLLLFTTMTEACMMVKTRDFLFAYNADKALCISWRDGDIENAVNVARRLYGPIFDKDCAKHFSSSPRSLWMRNLFYVFVAIIYAISFVDPIYHLINSIRTSAWSFHLLAAWLLIIFDGVLIINRIYFRASIRRFWAMILGDSDFRAILRFELSNADPHLLPACVVHFRN